MSAHVREKAGGNCFFVESAGVRWSRVLFGRIAAAVAVVGGKLYVYIACRREAKPERAKRWLPALVGSLIFQGWLGGM